MRNSNFFAVHVWKFDIEETGYADDRTNESAPDRITSLAHIGATLIP